jgi:hypothetical protein
MEHKVLLVLRENRDHKEHKVLRENKVHKVLLDKTVEMV